MLFVLYNAMPVRDVSVVSEVLLISTLLFDLTAISKHTVLYQETRYFGIRRSIQDTEQETQTRFNNQA